MEEELKQHLFELSNMLDVASVKKDYQALRLLHYQNQQWIKEHGLGEEYYNYFCEKLYCDNCKHLLATDGICLNCTMHDKYEREVKKE